MDEELHARLFQLADAVRRLPAEDDRVDAVVQRLGALIVYLEEEKLISPGTWHLGPRR